MNEGNNRSGSVHPEWVLKHKGKGKEIKKIQNRYYLYEMTSKWNKEKKVTQKISKDFIGRITEEGLVLKGTKQKEKSNTRDLIASKINIKESGATAFITELAEELLSKLKQCFPGYGEELFVIAINRLIYTAPLKNMNFLYSESMLSETIPDLNLNKNRLTTIMQIIGGDREGITEFMKQCMVGIEHIVFDTTNLISQSKKMSLNQSGYNSKGEYEPQVNLLYLFSTDKQAPVYYRIFPGNVSGMKALKLTIQESSLGNCTIIGDKGFYSEANIDMLEEAKINFILPLRRNSRFINYDRMSSRQSTAAFDGHFFYNKRVIYHYSYLYDYTTDCRCEILDCYPKDFAVIAKNTIVIFVEQKNVFYAARDHAIMQVVPSVENEKVLSKLIRGEKTLSAKDAKCFIMYAVLKHYLTHQIVLFYDAKLMLAEHTNYLQRVNDECEDYSIDSFALKELTFGTFAIIHNCTDVTAYSLYVRYKSRMEVETVFDTYKNLLQADRSYMQSDRAFEAWTFINHLSTIMYYKIFSLIKNHNKLTSISPNDLLLKLSRVQKIKLNTLWHSTEVPSSSITLFKKLGITVT